MINMEEKVEPKFKGVTFGRLLVTANEIVTDSGIILADIPNKPGKTLSDIQTVIAVGPMVKEENGLNVKAGDKVLLDVSSPKMGLPIAFNKITGEIAGPTDTEKTSDVYFLIESRSVLMVL
jgi:co-chaperonin GroES (HSP10)